MADYHRHDLSDAAWECLKGKLPGHKGVWGGIVRDNRKLINGVFWILCTGAPWRDLPSDYGDWKNTHRRFSRWRDKGVWERVLETLSEEPELKWLMIDASHIKVQPSWNRGERRQPRNRAYKRGLNTKLHLAMDAHGKPVRAQLTAGTVADCSQAIPLLECQRPCDFAVFRRKENVRKHRERCTVFG